MNGGLIRYNGALMYNTTVHPFYCVDSSGAPKTKINVSGYLLGPDDSAYVLYTRPDNSSITIANIDGFTAVGSTHLVASATFTPVVTWWQDTSAANQVNQFKSHSAYYKSYSIQEEDWPCNITTRGLKLSNAYLSISAISASYGAYDIINGNYSYAYATCGPNTMQFTFKPLSGSGSTTKPLNLGMGKYYEITGSGFTRTYSGLAITAHGSDTIQMSSSSNNSSTKDLFQTSRNIQTFSGVYYD